MRERQSARGRVCVCVCVRERETCEVKDAVVGLGDEDINLHILFIKKIIRILMYRHLYDISYINIHIEM